MGATVRVLLCCPEAEAVGTLFRYNSPESLQLDFDCAGEELDQLLDAVNRCGPDVVLFSRGWSVERSEEQIRCFREQFPELPVIIFAIDPNSEVDAQGHSCAFVFFSDSDLLVVMRGFESAFAEARRLVGKQ